MFHFFKRLNNRIIKRLSNQRGISLLLAMIVMTGMLAAALAVSDVLNRTISMVGKIGVSEKAYYAAETAAEKVLYQINKEHKNISTEINGSGSLESGLEYSLIDTNPITTKSQNSFLVEAGKSLQLDLDINGANYPTSLTVDGTAGTVMFLTLNNTDPFSAVNSEECNNFNLPSPLPCTFTTNFDDYYYKIRINNTTVSDITYTTDVDVPIAVVIKTKGTYRGTERIIETKDLKWQVY